MQSCCCCCNLRQGTIASTIYSLIWSGIILGYLGYMIFLVEKSKSAVERLYQLAGIEQPRSSQSLLTLPETGMYIMTAIFALWFLFSILALVGVCTRKRGFLMPWIIVTALICAAYIAWIILTFLAIGLNIVFGVAVAINGLFLALNIYAVVGVSFYFKELGLAPDEACGQQFIPMGPASGQPQGMYYPQQTSAPPDYKEKDQPPNY